jgi:hypothetical protein
MGGGYYDLDVHQKIVASRAAAPAAAVFQQNHCHPEMNPQGVRVRECRDSANHPDSVGLVFALDVSGSMGEIPQQLATGTLPAFMKLALSALPDAALLFLAFGNAWSDRSPLQVGQFESEAPLMDRWLSLCHLEGEGGGLGESYDLAMYFAARHTSMDCWEKRGRKGYFFMTGDEVPFVHLDDNQARGLLGAGPGTNIPIHVLGDMVLERFHAFFFIPDAARDAQWNTGPTWRQLWGPRVITLAETGDMALAAAALIGVQEGQLGDGPEIEKKLIGDLGVDAAQAERVTRAVLPYLSALKAGQLGPSRALARREKPEQIKG